MKQLGLKHFRLSLSWPRLLPGARKGSAVNPDAVRFYGAVLDELIAAGARGWELNFGMCDCLEGLSDEFQCSAVSWSGAGRADSSRCAWAWLWQLPAFYTYWCGGLGHCTEVHRLN